jgi:hypothetical protein
MQPWNVTSETMPAAHAKLTPEAVGNFVLAGRSVFTLRNTKTGNRVTYRVRRLEKDAARAGQQSAIEMWFVDVLAGPENTTDYRYIGIITRSGFNWTTKSKVATDAPSVEVFRWFWRQAKRDGARWTITLPAHIEVWHAGTCGRCGRALTVPESIQTGLGPVCAGLS